VTGPSIAPSACTVSRPYAQSRVRRVTAGAGTSGGGAVCMVLSFCRGAQQNAVRTASRLSPSSGHR
jgi:hypothetical protein